MIPNHTIISLFVACLLWNVCVCRGNQQLRGLVPQNYDGLASSLLQPHRRAKSMTNHGSKQMMKNEAGGDSTNAKTKETPSTPKPTHAPSAAPSLPAEDQAAAPTTPEGDGGDSGGNGADNDDDTVDTNDEGGDDSSPTTDANPTAAEPSASNAPEPAEAPVSSSTPAPVVSPTDAPLTADPTPAPVLPFAPVVDTKHKKKPTNPPSAAYVALDDDPIIDEELEEEKSKEQAEVREVEKEAKAAGGIGFLLALLAMVFTAHQMSENPDGIYASVCRLCITVIACGVKLVLMPCRNLLGLNRYHAGHIPVSTMEYREPYRGGSAMEMT